MKQLLHQLYELYAQAMYTAAYQILHESYAAEDAVHNAFLKISAHPENIGMPEEKRTRNYVLIIARNEAIRIYHQNQKMIPAEEFDETIPDLQDIELETESKETKYKIYKLICSLDPIYRDILLLKFYYDMEDSEIAETLSITLANARVRLHRARNRLKRRIREVYHHE